MKIGKISAKIHEIGKIKAFFGLGMTPIYGLKNGQIKSLYTRNVSIGHGCPRNCQIRINRELSLTKGNTS